MLIKSEVIVLGAVKYGDSSVILRTYSREHGLISFIAGGVRNRKGPIKPSMTQVFSILQVVYYSKAKGELKRIKEASVSEPLQEVFYHPMKSGMAMFLAEILQHVIHEEESNPPLYEFLHHAVHSLDALQKGLAYFHLEFLYQLTDYLGFRPEEPLGKPVYFDLLNGVYSASEPMHAHFLHGQALQHWIILDHFDTDVEGQRLLNLEQRRQLLDHLILYYRLHVRDFGRLKTLDVLTEILS